MKINCVLQLFRNPSGIVNDISECCNDFFRFTFVPRHYNRGKPNRNPGFWFLFEFVRVNTEITSAPRDTNGQERTHFVIFLIHLVENRKKKLYIFTLSFYAVALNSSSFFFAHILNGERVFEQQYRIYIFNSASIFLSTDKIAAITIQTRPTYHRFYRIDRNVPCISS